MSNKHITVDEFGKGLKQAKSQINAVNTVATDAKTSANQASNAAQAAQAAAEEAAAKANTTIKAKGGSHIGDVGNPTVTASTSGNETTFTFDYLKGATGTNGSNGADGRGISSIAITYQQTSSSSTTPPTGSWSSSIPTPTAGYYLWTKIVVNYTSGSPDTFYSVSRNGSNGTNGKDGTNGTNGSDGRGISSIRVLYKQTESSSTTPPDSWVGGIIPSPIAGQYLWTRIEVNYTSGKSDDFYIFSRNGSDGTVTVDSSLSSTSSNPVRNSVINSALNNKMDKENPTGTGSFSLNRKANSVVGGYSFACGISTTASGSGSHAEGYNTTANGSYSHAEGYSTTASESGSHAEGYSTTASESGSHAEGDRTTASGASSHAEGNGTTASRLSSHAEGNGTAASGSHSHAEGKSTKAEGESSHAEGNGTVASGVGAHAEGSVAGGGSNKISKVSYNISSAIASHVEGAGTYASGNCAHAEGDLTSATVYAAHAEGMNTIASGDGAHASGGFTTAAGGYSCTMGRYTYASEPDAVACGYATKAAHSKAFAGGMATVTNQQSDFVIGQFNAQKTDSLFTIGYGTGSYIVDITSDTIYADQLRSKATLLNNVFRVNNGGATYGVGAFNTSGADYAEYIKPWFDDNADNEDRRGYFVTIRNGKLYKAEPGDYIVGITSGNPSVIGNGDEDWLGRWKRDEFNELIFEDIKVDDYETQIDEDGKPIQVKAGSHTERHTVQVENYDPTQKYIERKDRPEWSCVGMIGVIPLRDDGTCEAGGFAKCGEGGIATKADKYQGHKTFFVIERINDHIISVEMR